MRRLAVAILVVVFMALAVGCASGDSTAEVESTSTAQPDSQPSSEAPAVTIEQAYRDAAAYGAARERPFEVFYPAYLPNGFTLDKAEWIDPDDVPEGRAPGLYVTYTRDESVIGIGVAMGDIGESEPVATLPWGSTGEVSVYRDAWENSYIAVYPSSSEYTPVVRTIDVTLGELTAVLGSMTKVEP
jgi:hypothetical protein